jgi:hypothetical protein
MSFRYYITISLRHYAIDTPPRHYAIDFRYCRCHCHFAAFDITLIDIDY